MGSTALGGIRTLPQPSATSQIAPAISNQRSTGMTPFDQASKAQSMALAGTQAAMNYQPERVTGVGYDAAQAAGVDAIREQQVRAGMLPDVNMTDYMNPYTQGVIDTSMQDLERQRLMQQNDIGAQATSAGAFGGSRHGVAESLTNEAFARQGGQLAANLRQSGFTNAQQAAQADLARAMQAGLANQGANLTAQQSTAQNALNTQFNNMNSLNQSRQFTSGAQNAAALANQSAGLQGASLRQGAAQQMGNLGQQSFGYGQTLNQDLMNQGTQQQALQQALIDASKSQYGAYTGQPASSLSLMTAALGGTPYGQTQTNTKQLGMMDYLTAGAGFMASDVRLKDNVTLTGKTGSGINTYTWSWNDEGKRITGKEYGTGVIAQEVQKVAPDAVVEGVDGYLRVDYGHPALEGVNYA